MTNANDKIVIIIPCKNIQMNSLIWGIFTKYIKNGKYNFGLLKKCPRIIKKRNIKLMAASGKIIAKICHLSILYLANKKSKQSMQNDEIAKIIIKLYKMQRTAK